MVIEPNTLIYAIIVKPDNSVWLEYMQFQYVYCWKTENITISDSPKTAAKIFAATLSNIYNLSINPATILKLDIPSLTFSPGKGFFTSKYSFGDEKVIYQLYIQAKITPPDEFLRQHPLLKQQWKKEPHKHAL